MRSFTAFTVSLLCVNFLVKAQGSAPQNPSAKDNSVLSWTKTGESGYILLDANSDTITNVKKLNRLKTDTLSYLDKDSRTIYLLPDCVDAAIDSSGKLSVLKRNISKDFYITNPKSFVTYIDDNSYQGDFVNMNGSYIYYIEEFDQTFYLKDIRKYTEWGASDLTTLDYAPNNTYWYRNVDKKSYGVIIKGMAINYDEATTEKDGNDLVVIINGVFTYRLSGYYTMGSFVIKPIELYTASSEVSGSSVGCVKGDCMSGWGTWQEENGNYYEGFWNNGKKNGYGLYYSKGIGKYIGNWANDDWNGYGAYIGDDEENRVGEYKNGKLNGRGYKVIESEWSQGMFADGALEEPFSFNSNNKDSGCVSGDCTSKYGRLKWSNGDSFIGFFKDGKMYMGTYSYANGDKYVGMFNEQEKFEGTGRFFFKAGGYYGGAWKNGRYHGRGYFHDQNYVRQIGEWNNGVLVKDL